MTQPTYRPHKGGNIEAANVASDTITEVTAAAGVTIDGVLCKDSAVNARQPIVSVNANTDITAAQTGTLFIVSAAGGGAGITLSLPATTAGLQYTFFVLTLPSSGVFGISPVAADKFIGNGLSGVDNKDLQHPTASDAIGDWVRIVGDGADGWLIVGSRGTFAIET